MKRIFTGVLMVLSVYCAQAQTNTFPSSGSVGIGTTNPLTLFDVRLTTNEHVQFVQDLNSAATGFSGIVCINDANSTYTPLGFWANKYYFGGGNFGIGTANPAATLDVNGSQHLNGDLTFSNDQTAYFIHGPANGGAIRIRSNSVAASDRDVQFGMIDNNGAWASVMTVGNNSNVGIGTTSPGYKLEVAGSFGTRGMMGNGSTGQYYEVTPYEIASHNNAGWAGTMIGIRSGGMNSTSIPITQNVLANSTAYQQAWAMTFGTDKSQTNGAAFSVWTGDATNAGTPMSELFRIRYDGNVGIGTVNPGSYKLAVNGGIHSQSVNVDLTGWSDYVFKKDYTLPSLTEVKAYIDQNHHLPDMPSEKDVIKDGINLGEMNKLLTKKVEELTLYLIEKDQENKELKQAMKAQQEDIALIKKQLETLMKTLNNK